MLENVYRVLVSISPNFSSIRVIINRFCARKKRKRKRKKAINALTFCVGARALGQPYKTTKAIYRYMLNRKPCNIFFSDMQKIKLDRGRIFHCSKQEKSNYGAYFVFGLLLVSIQFSLVNCESLNYSHRHFSFPILFQC